MADQFNNIPPSVPNDPMTVALNLRTIDPNSGLPIDRLLPRDYIYNIGGNLSQQIANYTSILNSLSQTNAAVANQQIQINNILTSGFTQPSISAGCLLSSGTGFLPLPTITNLLVSNTCSYNAALGTPSALYQAVGSQCANLNTFPSFSIPSGVMQSLAGWKPTPVTIADTLTNNWIAYCDARAGISKALAALTPICAQVIVNVQATYTGNLTFNFYFSGYSFIPSGFADNGSTITIADTQNNTYTVGFNIVTQSNTPSPLVIMTSGSTLSSQSSTYTATINSSVINPALGLTCAKAILIVIGESTQTTGCCPDIGTFTTFLSSGTTALTVVSSLSYTPRYADWEPGNAFTSAQFYPGGAPPYVTRTLGGFTLHFGAPTGAAGTILLDWITFR